MLGAASSALAAKTYTDNSDGTVTDPSTGLIWMRCAMGQTWAGGTCTGTAIPYTFAKANALTGKQTFAGQSDWRVPNIRELHTIVDRSRSNPSIDTTVFPNTSSSSYWSSSLYSVNTTYAWIVYFTDGFSGDYWAGYDSQVRLVRGGQSSVSLLNIARPTSDYVDQANGTVTHTPTGLMWKRCAEGQLWSGTTCTGTASTMTADQAKTLSARYAGYTDWRVPTMDELISLLDYRVSSPAVNATIFPATPDSFFWSGSLYASGSLNAWGIRFMDGAAYGQSGSLASRLVRPALSLGSFALSVSKTGNGAITSAPDGIDCGNTCSASFTSGTSVTLTATPDAGNTLTGWNGACSGTASTCTVGMDTAKSVTANFRPNATNDWLNGVWLGQGTQTDGRTWSIRVTAESGIFQIEYPSLSCGGTLASLASSWNSANQNVSTFSETITSGPASCVTGGTVEITSLSAQTAQFVYYLPSGKLDATGSLVWSAPTRSLVAVTSGNGTITSTPAGITCGSTCNASFTIGSSVTLTATPATGST
ncbi:MAG: DUF1566 domain-containing protein, partial [Burkholderiales bacterium]